MNNSVFIATTLHGMFPHEYVKNLMRISLTHMVNTKQSMGYDVYTNEYRHLGRQALVDAARKVGCSHIFFIDADQCDIPDDILSRWLKVMDEDKGKRVISGLYFSSKGEPQPVAFDFLEDDQMTPFYDYPKNIMVKARAIGGGCKLVDLTVYDDIDMPWYETKGGFGEDIHFSNQCFNAGIPVWLDTSVSIGHLPKKLMPFNEKTYEIMRALGVKNWEEAIEKFHELVVK